MDKDTKHNRYKAADCFQRGSKLATKTKQLYKRALTIIENFIETRSH
jgi:hypothetical protein